MTRAIEVNKPNKKQQKVLDMFADLITDEKRYYGKRGNQVTVANENDLYERFVILFVTSKKEHWGWHNIKSEGFPTSGIRLITKNVVFEYHFSEELIKYACSKQAHFFKEGELVCNCRLSRRNRRKKID